MDRDWGAKTGGGGVASGQNANIDRRERLRRLALETIDLNKDPYFMRNHLGSYECRLCLTLHNNEGNYLAHTQGKRHQTNLARRAAKDAQTNPSQPAPLRRTNIKKRDASERIGKPGYRVIKQYDPESKQNCLLFRIEYPEISEGIQPRHRIVNPYEQNVEPANPNYQYVVFAADPYETIAFKIPKRKIDSSEGKFYTDWDLLTKTFTLQLYFLESVSKKQDGQDAQDMNADQ
eukprot:TRINITY_DN7496_c0_g1_i1.p1 TRINITY_DN7496_c0_g1~~TRINITY_DN7496_c0_g1_i1.p1  ORF type:complete len:233 (+),score=55.09 TRINITY_DN7496_c0_g1_i1:50-748(+)